MKFFMCSACGEGAALLHDIQLEGNEVELYIKDPEYRRVWDGLGLPKVEKPEPPEGAVVIFDFSGMGKLAAELRSAGYAVVGGSEIADRLEQDRMFGLDFAEKAGIKVPLTANFNEFSVKEVQDFIAEYEPDKRWAFKPSGKSLPCFLTYCSNDAEDLLCWVKYVEKNYGKDIESFVLQEFVEGVCVSSEAWCDGFRFVRPFNHTVEVKASMNSNLGPSTGCSGNLVWLEHDDSCRIIQEGIARIERAIVDAGHVGPVDANCVVNEKGCYFLEWTCRFGFSALPTFSKMIVGGVGKLFSDVARGQGGALQLEDKFGSAVKLSIPPYPVEPEKQKDAQKVTPNIGIPIRGIPEGTEKNFYFYEIELDQDDPDLLVHSAGTGVIADVIGLDDDPAEAFEKPYEILEQLIIPNKQYRTDLDSVLSEMYEQVKEQERLASGKFVEVWE